MQDPIFSIVIPTYNRADLLRRCLSSVVAQTENRWEAIIVDNFSEDDTEDVVKCFCDTRIRYIKNHNYGVISVSRNRALDMARGKYICFLDSDDYWLPCKLKEILPFMAKYDLVYHDYFTNKKKKFFFSRTPGRSYAIKEVSISYVIQRGDPITPSCACVSMAAIGDTRFDESINLFAVEDYDFFLQLMRKNILVKKLNRRLTFYDSLTGCSHGFVSLERDMLLYQKYRDLLSDKEKDEFLKLHCYKEGDYYKETGDYDKAIPLLKEACSSSIFRNKKRAFMAMLHCYLYRLTRNKIVVF